MLKPIYDITSYTLVDYPNHSSCVVWFSGCNLKCQYCYNTEILPFNSGTKSIQDLLNFLDTRKGLLDAVVLSGGEATIHNLIPLCIEIKKMGFKIKLDTNGTNPKMLKEIVEKNLVDYISLDIKAATKEKFNQITGLSDNNNIIKKNILKTIQILNNNNSNINYECRTTIHSDLLSIDDIIQCINLVYNFGYRGSYALQLALNDVNTLCNLQNTKMFDKTELIMKSKLNIEFRNF